MDFFLSIYIHEVRIQNYIMYRVDHLINHFVITSIDLLTVGALLHLYICILHILHYSILWLFNFRSFVWIIWLLSWIFMINPADKI